MTELTAKDLKGPRKKVNDDVETAYRISWMDKALKKRQSLEDQGIKTDVLYEKRQANPPPRDNIIDVIEDEEAKGCVVCDKPVIEEHHQYCPKCYDENKPLEERETTLDDYDEVFEE